MMKARSSRPARRRIEVLSDIRLIPGGLTPAIASDPRSSNAEAERFNGQTRSTTPGCAAASRPAAIIREITFTIRDVRITRKCRCRSDAELLLDGIDIPEHPDLSYPAAIGRKERRT